MEYTPQDGEVVVEATGREVDNRILLSGQKASFLSIVPEETRCFEHNPATSSHNDSTLAITVVIFELGMVKYQLRSE